MVAKEAADLVMSAGGNSARDDILGRLGTTLNRVDGREERQARAAARVATPPDNLIPDRSMVDRDGQIALFREMAEEVSATTARIPSLDDLPGAVADYLGRHNLPSRIKTDGDGLLAEAGWEAHPTLEVSRGVATGDDDVSVTAAFAGVAETGTAVMLSGADHPTSLNFLPENHIIVLPLDRLHGTYEDAWARLQDIRQESGMPRTVNWITGPSRTGDIEQTLQLGVHGPRRLHIILVDDGEEKQS